MEVDKAIDIIAREARVKFSTTPTFHRNCAYFALSDARGHKFLVVVWKERMISGVNQGQNYDEQRGTSS